MGGEGVDVAGCEVGDGVVDADVGVDGGEALGGGEGLGRCGVGVELGVEALALEVGGFDDVAVDEGEAANAGTGEEVGGDAAERAQADDAGVGGEEALLRIGAKVGEDGLSRVPVGAGHDERVRCGAGGQEARRRRSKRGRSNLTVGMRRSMPSRTARRMVETAKSRYHFRSAGMTYQGA